MFGCVSAFNLVRNTFYSTYSLQQAWVLESYSAFVNLSKPRSGPELFQCKQCEDAPRQVMQGLFIPFACVGSGDPVRVLCLLHNKYTGYN